MSDDHVMCHAHPASSRHLSRRALLQYLAGGAAMIHSSAAVATSMPMRMRIPAHNVRRLAWSRDGQYIAGSNLPCNYVACWESRSGRKLWQHDIAPSTHSLPMTFVEESNSLAAICGSGYGRDEFYACLLAAGTGEVGARVSDLAMISPQSAAPVVMCGAADQSTLAVSFTTRNQIAIITFGPRPSCKWVGPVRADFGRDVVIFDQLALSPTGAYLAVSFSTGEVQIIDTQTNRVIRKILAYRQSVVSSLAFASETLLVTSSRGLLAAEWTHNVNRDAYIFAPATIDEATSLSPLKNVVRLWDFRQGRFVSAFGDEDSSGTEDGSVAACGKFVAALFRSGELQVWSIDGRWTSRMAVPEANPVLIQGDVAIAGATGEIAVASTGSIHIFSCYRE